MSISRTGGPETHMVRIQMAEGFAYPAEWMQGIARELGLQGRGAIDGRMIYMMLNARTLEIEQLIDRLLSTLEKSAHVTLIGRERLPYVQLSGFRMVRDSASLPLRERHATGGDNMCPDCRTELKDPNGRRSGYPFTECIVCAPVFEDDDASSSRESINGLTCASCREEASDPTSRRYRFAEISCPECGPPLFWQRRGETRWQQPVRETLRQAASLIHEGGILAIKGTGGYHLVCDASNERSIRNLRHRKGNLLKPITVMYPGLSEAALEMDINEQQAAALLSSTGSIVICPFRNTTEGPGIARTSLAGILDRLGLMLPHSPLMQVISSFIDGPLAVTSANRAGMPVIHRSESRSELWDLADAVIDHDRQILRPREEPVILFTDNGERILLRSAQAWSHGLSVDWHDASIGNALAISKQSSIGYLNDSVYRRMNAVIDKNTTDPDSIGRKFNDERFHLPAIRPEIIITERSVKQSSDDFAAVKKRWPDIPHMYSWHHEAHFYSVLSEHGQLHTDEAILGIVWDRGGYGADGQLWGSEFILRKQGRMHHIAAFDYIPNAGLNKEETGCRIAALGLLRHRLDARRLIGHLFSRNEWPRYERRAMRVPDARSRSMSGFIDGVAAILGLIPEGLNGDGIDGLPLIETVARRIQMDISLPYELYVVDGAVDWRPMIDTMIGDIDSGAGREMIARRFLASLATLVADVCLRSGVKKVALSGDAFTSPLLVSMISEQLGQDVTLYIHHFLAPTDECVTLGQLALWADAKHRSLIAGSDVRSSVRGATGRNE